MSSSQWQIKVEAKGSLGALVNSYGADSDSDEDNDDDRKVTKANLDVNIPLVSIKQEIGTDAEAEDKTTAEPMTFFKQENAMGETSNNVVVNPVLLKEDERENEDGTGNEGMEANVSSLTTIKQEASDADLKECCTEMELTDPSATIVMIKEENAVSATAITDFSEIRDSAEPKDSGEKGLTEELTVDDFLAQPYGAVREIKDELGSGTDDSESDSEDSVQLNDANHGSESDESDNENGDEDE